MIKSVTFDFFIISQVIFNVNIIFFITDSIQNSPTNETPVALRPDYLKHFNFYYNKLLKKFNMTGLRVVHIISSKNSIYNFTDFFPTQLNPQING